MTAEPMTDEGEAIARLSEHIALAGARCDSGVIRIAWADAAWLLSQTMHLRAALDAERSRADAAEAERDAAVARAMPEPVLVQTAAEVGALTVGAYRLAPPWRPRGKWILGRRHPPGTWTLLIGAVASGVKDDHIVGSWVQPLPDLPIPTAAQEG